LALDAPAERNLMEFILYAFAALLLLVLALSFIAPARVEYTEEIIVEAPVAQVYDDIRLQDHLMRWSAWPKETGSTCTVDGSDGEVGTRVLFFTKAKRIGHQEIIALEENNTVVLTLVGPGPPHHPRLRFDVRPCGETATTVAAHFVNDLPRPFNIIWKFAGLSAWTRRMHRKDLEGLKAFAEPPHRDSDGRVVGRPPGGDNPYQHREHAA